MYIVSRCSLSNSSSLYPCSRQDDPMCTASNSLVAMPLVTIAPLAFCLFVWFDLLISFDRSNGIQNESPIFFSGNESSPGPVSENVMFKLCQFVLLLEHLSPLLLGLVFVGRWMQVTWQECWISMILMIVVIVGIGKGIVSPWHGRRNILILKDFNHQSNSQSVQNGSRR